MMNPADMRARFHALGKQRNEILATSKPIRDRYEAMRAEETAIRQRMAPVIAEMKAAESPLYDIDTERSMIAKALSGKTGEPG